MNEWGLILTIQTKNNWYYCPDYVCEYVGMCVSLKGDLSATLLKEISKHILFVY